MNFRILKLFFLFWVRICKIELLLLLFGVLIIFIILFFDNKEVVLSLSNCLIKIFK